MLAGHLVHPLLRMTPLMRPLPVDNLKIGHLSFLNSAVVVALVVAVEEVAADGEVAVVVVVDGEVTVPPGKNFSVPKQFHLKMVN